MHEKRLILVTALVMALFAVKAQENNNWYFGNGAAITFNPVSSTIPSPLYNSTMIAFEGCSSISDSAGNLLFYSNGETIYNRNHAVMLNGSGLLGHSSSFQGVIIVPQPNSKTIYYVFTADAAENAGNNGYRYSIVDMNRDNGNGEVITKNTLLYAPSCERLTAARHGNGVDVWIITNDKASNVFRSWLLTCTGLQPAPVMSTTGVVLNQTFDEIFGCLKVSPDGRNLCQTNFPEIDGVIPENFFQLFDFNNGTGVISNPRLITVPNQRYYACEFSPDSRFIYLSKAQTREVDQFEVLPGNTPAAVVASRITIPADFGFYGLQTGPDNKIYITRQQQKLTVIENPNVKGLGCNLVVDKVQSPGFAGLNLPNMVNDLAVTNNISYTILDSCNRTIQFQGSTTMGGTLQWYWDFGDGTTANVQNPVHTFPADQIYKVKLRVVSATLCGSVEKSINIFPGGTFADARFDFVPRCDSGYVRFVNNSLLIPDNGGQYTWDFGDGTTSHALNPIHTYPGAGTYTVTLTIHTGTACLDDVATTTLNLETLTIQAPPDQVLDAGQSFQLYVTGGGTSFTWSPATWLSDPAIENPVAKPEDDITYVVTAYNDAGCKSVDSVSIKVNPVEGIFVPTAFTPNDDGLNDVLKPTFGLNYTLVEFSVYNRWGQRVFITKEKGKGWDGKYNGRVQTSNSYVWVITVKTRSGELVQKKGVFTLIR